MGDDDTVFFTENLVSLLGSVKDHLFDAYLDDMAHILIAHHLFDDMPQRIFRGIQMAYPDGLCAFVVGMASDKDHLAFARQLLTGRRPDIVLLTEVSIAGGKSRITPASTLKDAWVRTATNLDLDIMDLGMIDEEPSLHVPRHNKSMILSAFQNLPICSSIKVADHFLKSRERDKPALIVVTGSLHVVSSVLAAVHH